MSIDAQMPPPPRRGRPRLPDDVRIARIRAAKKSWADAHRDYVRAQIARLHARPEYKARRRELYKLKRQAVIQPPADGPPAFT